MSRQADIRDEARKRVAQILRSEMVRHGASYDDMAERLEMPKGSFANKLSRGAFTAAWFLKALEAAGTKRLEIT